MSHDTKLEKMVNEMIEHFDDQPSSMRSYAAKLYLRGIRDGLAGADAQHITENVKMLSS